MAGSSVSVIPWMEDCTSSSTRYFYFEDGREEGEVWHSLIKMTIRLGVIIE